MQDALVRHLLHDAMVSCCPNLEGLTTEQRTSIRWTMENLMKKINDYAV
jgi:hypothetical protein